MADPDDQLDSRADWRSKPWQGRLIASLLIVAGMLHAFKPSWLTLDWPSITLILTGILLLFLPLDDLGSVIESLEVGKTKILFRKVKQLDDAVEQAIHEEQAPSDLYREEGNRTPVAALGDNDQRMQSLLETDKEMALIRIGIELERILAGLDCDNGYATRTPGIAWSRTIQDLERREQITPQMAKALIKFRNVRNQLIHPSAGAVPEALVASAVDSGLKLLRLLSSIAEMNKALVAQP